MDLFHRKPKRQMSELEQAIANGVVQQTAGKPQSETEHQHEMAEDYLILKDVKAENIIFGMSRYTFKDNTNVMGGGTDKEYTGAYPGNMAIAMTLSTLFRTGWVSEKQARIMLLENESLYLRREMMMTEQEFEEGGELFFDSLRSLAADNIVGSINGRLSKLVKSRPHNIDVNVGTNPNGKGGNIQ
jgi:hypothetical protein